MGMYTVASGASNRPTCRSWDFSACVSRGPVPYYKEIDVINPLLLFFFFLLRWVLAEARRMFVEACGIFPLRPMGSSVVAACGLSSCGMQA